MSARRAPRRNPRSRWAGLVALASAGCLPSYELAEGDGTGETTSVVGTSTSTVAATSTGSASSSSAGTGAGGAGGGATSSSSSGGGGGGGGEGGSDPCVALPEDLVGHWIADDAVEGLRGGESVIKWPSRSGVGGDLDAKEGPAPVVADDAWNGHAQLRFETLPFPVEPRASYLEGNLPPGDTSVNRDGVTIVVVGEVDPDWDTAAPFRMVQWGDPVANNGKFCIGEGATVGLGASPASLTFVVQHAPGASNTCAGSGATRAISAGRSIFVGMRRRFDRDARNYLRQNGESLFPGGERDRFGGVEFTADEFRVGAPADQSEGFHGKVAEILAYRRALSPKELQCAERLLGEKYEIDVRETPEPCDNDGLDDGEVGVNCSGECLALCTLGDRCTRGEDCESGLCDTTALVPICIATPSGYRIEVVPGASFDPDVSPFAAYFDAAAEEVRVLAEADGGATVVFGFDGVAWTEVAEAPVPPARKQPAVYQDGERTWVFGGEANGLQNDLWIWDGTGWSTPIVSDAPRLQAAGMALDGAGSLMVFGGVGTDGDSRATYRLDVEPALGSAWFSLPAMLEVPAIGVPGAYADDVYRVIAAAGGLGGQTVSCTANACDEAGSIASILESRVGHGMVRDTRRRRVVLLGGTDDAGSSDVLEWYPFPQQRTLSTTPWLTTVASGGPVGTLAAATYDPVRQRVVAVERGGSARTFEYWAVASACMEPIDCAQGTCVHGICCEEACGDGERCDSETAPGVCVPD